MKVKVDMKNKKASGTIILMKELLESLNGCSDIEFHFDLDLVMFYSPADQAVIGSRLSSTSANEFWGMIDCDDYEASNGFIETYKKEILKSVKKGHTWYDLNDNQISP